MRIRWRGFELPTRCVPVDSQQETVYGKFIVEPFERGFGHTLGNGFRRILLSSIEGSAVIAIRFNGVKHEFTTIQGVYEDVQEIVLNIKELNFRMTGEERKSEVTIAKKGEGEVKGSDIKCPAGVEVINPDHLIATLTDKGAEFSAEMIIEKNRGYQSADENMKILQGQEIPEGYISVDSTFSPVLRVKYSVEDCRVGKITNYDKLILEIWSDGTISPQDALLEASNIYKKHLNCFSRFRDIGDELEEKKKPGFSDEKLQVAKDKLESKFNTSIEELGLSVRTINCLSSKGLNTVGDIIQKSETEIQKIRNFGKTSAKELKAKMSELELSFQMSLEEEMVKLEQEGVE